MDKSPIELSCKIRFINVDLLHFSAKGEKKNPEKCFKE